MVVADRDRSLASLADALGVREPFALDPAAPDGSFRVALGVLRLENLLIEMIQPLDDRSPHAAFLARRGEGLHHVAFMVPELNGPRDRLLTAGCALDLDGAAAGSPMRVVYLSGQPLAGMVLELMEQSPAFDDFWKAATS